MAIVKLSPSAIKDLQEIKTYISDDLSNHIAAERTVKQIMDDYMLLEVSPYMGPSLSVIIHIETDFRYLVSGSHIDEFFPPERCAFLEDGEDDPSVESANESNCGCK